MGGAAISEILSRWSRWRWDCSWRYSCKHIRYWKCRRNIRSKRTVFIYLKKGEGWNRLYKARKVESSAMSRRREKTTDCTDHLIIDLQIWKMINTYSLSDPPPKSSLHPRDGGVSQTHAQIHRQHIPAIALESFQHLIPSHESRLLSLHRTRLWFGLHSPTYPYCSQLLVSFFVSLPDKNH